MRMLTIGKVSWLGVILNARPQPKTLFIFGSRRRVRDKNHTRGKLIIIHALLSYGDFQAYSKV
ncbi:hypothetical protein GKR41_00609 [Candidatus Vallotia lariciata]|nr:hypothetical protein GKR41_00609 [Candidatus Vallotia lariciata]